MTLLYALGGSFVVFLIAAIFWAGATYNRVGSIERQLGKIEQVLAKLANLGALEVKIAYIERRLERLDGQSTRAAS